MNILVDIGHPGHVHFFREPIRCWVACRHDVTVVTRDIPVAMKLLEAADLSAQVVSRRRSGAPGLAFELAEHTLRLLPVLRRSQIDVTVSIGGTYTVHASQLARRPRVVFTDTENATIANKITFPFASAVVTPEAFPLDLGSKHVRYRGIHELSYLHPHLFQPDANVLVKYDLSTNEPFSVLRFIRWEAGHDLGLEQPREEQRRTILEILQQQGQVLFVPEGNPPPVFADRVTPIQPEDFHHLLYFARVCVTEGATTASEACLLGTPSLYISPVHPACTSLMQDYGLLHMVIPGDDVTSALEKTLILADDPDTCASYARRFVADHTDVAGFVADFVVGFPSRSRA